MQNPESKLLTVLLAVLLTSGSTRLIRAEYPVFADGSQVRIEWLLPTQNDVVDTIDVTIGGGNEVEFENMVMNISANSISWDYLTDTVFLLGDFNGLRISDFTNSLPPFTTVTVVSPSVNLQSGNVHFDENSILVAYSRSGINVRGTHEQIDVSTSVPEPSTLILTTLAIILAITTRRRRF